MEEQLKEQLEKKIKKQKRTIIFLTIYVILTFTVQLYNALA